MANNSSKISPPQSSKKSEPMSNDESALMLAWARMLDYDEASTHQKKAYVRWRYVIIYLTIIITGLSILAALTPEDSILRNIYRLFLIALPLIITAIYNYSQRFATSAWIEFRYSAEKIRSEIYKFRTHVGEYNNDFSQKDRIQKLIDAVKENRKNLEKLPFLIPHLSKISDSTTDLETRGNNKDGMFGDISLDEYIKVRVKSQQKWYVDRVNTDHRNSRRFFIVVQLISILGGVLAGAGLEAWVALSVSVGVAMSLLSDIGGYGASYALFHWTAEKLETKLLEWQSISVSATPDDKSTMNEQGQQLVIDIESILADEREQWYRLMLEQQSRVTQSLQGIIDIPAKDKYNSEDDGASEEDNPENQQ